MSTFTVNTNDRYFKEAVAEVERDYLCTIDVGKAELIINEVYSHRKGETGPAFKALVEKAVRKYSFIFFQYRWYLLVAMRYFNKRSVSAK